MPCFFNLDGMEKLLTKKMFLLALLVSITSWGQQTLHLDSVINRAARHYYTNPDSAQYYLHKGIRLAEAADNSYKKGIFLNKLITQKTRIKDWDSARYYYRFSKAYLEKNNLTTLIPDVHSEIAESYFYMDKLDSARYHFGRADSLYASIQDSIGVLISKNNIANVYQMQGNYKDAIVNLLEAAKNVDTTQFLYIKVELYQNISQLYRLLDEEESATSFAERSLTLALKNANKFPQDLVSAHCIRAQLYIDKRNFEAATNDIEKAEEWIAEKNLQSVDYKVSQVKGNLLLALGNYQQALPFLQEAITQGEQNYLSNFELYSLRKNLAETYRGLRRLNESESLLADMLATAEKDKRTDHQMEVYQLLSEVQRELGKSDKAYTSLKHYLELKDSILGIEKQQIIKDAIVRYSTLEKEKELLETQASLAESERRTLRLYGGLGMALLLALIAYLFYNQQRLKNRQLRKEAELKEALARIETQNKLQEQRLRISRDLHDNIGSQLTFITSSLDNLKFRLEGIDTPVANKLEDISAFTTQTIYELRDTIWAMNKESISIDDLKGRILNFLDKAGEAKQGIEFTFEHSESLTDEHTLPSVYGMNVYRIIQEAVNNALKYAKPTSIKVYLALEGSLYRLDIKDNGQGFDEQKIEPGNGLNNIRKRARDLNGKAEITSRLGQGTTVNVTFPRA